jgi:hypothetical protein
MKTIDLTGKRFNRLFVDSFSHSDDGLIYWNTICDCGTEKKIAGSRIKNGMTQSCGCLRMETIKRANTKHGHYVGGMKSKTYASWEAMMDRCYRPSSGSFHSYGAKGVTVCERWHKFENFLADMGDRPLNHQLDRKDAGLGYSLKNCRWLTHLENQQNRRNVRVYELNGELLTGRQIAERFDAPVRIVGNRLSKGLSIEDALSPPFTRS